MSALYPHPDQGYPATNRRRDNVRSSRGFTALINPSTLLRRKKACQAINTVTNNTLFFLQNIVVASNKSIEKSVLSRIYGRGRGSVCVPTEFLDLGSRGSIDLALSRLVKKAFSGGWIEACMVFQKRAV